MIDGADQLNDVNRTVNSTEANGNPAVAVMLSQTYPPDVRDLWDAITNPARLPRWFAPVGGNLQLNRHFQVENNASGTITVCQAPYSFDATWEFGNTISWIEVRLSEVDSQFTRLELTHTAHPDEHWDQFGPGAGGIGWDLSLLGLATHLESGANIHEAEPEWDEIDAAIQSISQSGKAWIEADVASGEDEAVARQRGLDTINFYTGVDREG